MKNMNLNSTRVKSLRNGVISWLVIALVLSLVKDLSLVQAFAAPYTIALALSAALGSYIGFERKKNTGRA